MSVQLSSFDVWTTPATPWHLSTNDSFELKKDARFQWRIQRGRNSQQALPQIWLTMCFFYIPFCIRMLKDEAQIARESIYKQEPRGA